MLRKMWEMLGISDPRTTYAPVLEDPNSVEMAERTASLSDMGNDPIAEVVKHLSPRAAMAFAQTNKQARDLVETAPCWQNAGARNKQDFTTRCQQLPEGVMKKLVLEGLIKLTTAEQLQPYEQRLRVEDRNNKLPLETIMLFDAELITEEMLDNIYYLTREATNNDQTNWEQLKLQCIFKCISPETEIEGLPLLKIASNYKAILMNNNAKLVLTAFLQYRCQYISEAKRQHEVAPHDPQRSNAYLVTISQEQFNMMHVQTMIQRGVPSQDLGQFRAALETGTRSTMEHVVQQLKSGVTVPQPRASHMRI